MKRFAATILLALAIAALSAGRGACQDAANLTAENRAALSETVEQLQQYELHKMSKGRMKPNPVVFPLHTVYQTVLQDQEFLLEKHKNIFENTLMRLLELRRGHDEVVSTAGGKIMADAFGASLIDIYSLSDDLRKQETILGVWKVLESAKFEMELLPARAGLAYDARKWARAMYGGEPPAEVSAALDSLSSEKLVAENIIGMESATRALAGKYSELFRRIAIGESLEAGGGGGAK